MASKFQTVQLLLLFDLVMTEPTTNNCPEKSGAKILVHRIVLYQGSIVFKNVFIDTHCASFVSLTREVENI